MVRRLPSHDGPLLLGLREMSQSEESVRAERRRVWYLGGRERRGLGGRQVCPHLTMHRLRLRRVGEPRGPWTMSRCIQIRVLPSWARKENLLPGRAESVGIEFGPSWVYTNRCA